MSKIVVGIDEVGRGPWAGPLVSAAVAFAGNERIRGLKDSKLLNSKLRHGLAYKICQSARSVGIGWATHLEIDDYGLTQATRLSMFRALSQINCGLDMIIIDGSFNYLSEHHSSLAVIKADQKYKCVSAASIIAKVARDSYMMQIAKAYPNYGFELHVGYGTKLHTENLQKYGASPIHRYSFAPIKALAWCLHSEEAKAKLLRLTI